jgi:hypothetical protein
MTAVEWLEKEFNKLEATVGVYGIMYSLIEQAKEMEKQQIIGTYAEGAFAQMRYYDGKPFINAEQYYNETYGK